MKPIFLCSSCTLIDRFLLSAYLLVVKGGHCNLCLLSKVYSFMNLIILFFVVYRGALGCFVAECIRASLIV